MAMSSASLALRVPPQDLDAEKSVLGAILVDASAISLVAEFLQIDHFYMRSHKLIYSAMLELFEHVRVIGVCMT